MVTWNLAFSKFALKDAKKLSAAGLRDKAQALLNAKINEVMVDLRKQFNQIRTGATRIEALKEAVASAENLVVATRKSVAGGQRANPAQLSGSRRRRIPDRHGRARCSRDQGVPGVVVE